MEKNRALEEFNRAWSSVDLNNLDIIRERLQYMKTQGGTLYLIGNGGSLKICEHAAIDLYKKFQIKVYIADSGFITMMANDNHYFNIFSLLFYQTLSKNDVVIAVSSSGESVNIIRAVQIATADDVQAFTVTMTGFKDTNSLRKLGDLNIWVNSYEYAIVETVHSLLLHLVGD